MWTITLRDLQHRGRQFGIAVAGAAVVFALTVLLTGISAGFRTEARDTVAAIGADAWIVPRGVTGPFTSQTGMPLSAEARVRALPGVREAHQFVRFSYVARTADGDHKTVNVIGHDIGALGDPVWGVAAARPVPSGRAVVDERLGVGRGAMLRVADRSFEVVDVVSHRTELGGVPTVYVAADDARALAFAGRRLINAVIVRGTPRGLPATMTARTNAEVRADMLVPLEGATTVIDTLRLLMWVVAAMIIGAVTYLSALERVRDFAVLKAVGGSSQSLALGLAAQALIASVLAAALGIVIAVILRPLFPVPVTLSPGALVALPAIAAVVGVLSSFAALRRALRVDPALAFSG
jgi:putative ABC transport system permease protein